MLRFDESLPTFVRSVVEELGAPAVSAGRIVRDAYGRLVFVSSTPMGSERLLKVQISVGAKLVPYADPERVILSSDQPGVGRILADSAAVQVTIPLDNESIEITMLDRRVVGADWLTPPQSRESDGPPYLVFTSLKGGVGRSTALSVLAVHLASHGKDVLVVDLDLEAPGLGTMLLSQDRRPRFGLIDLLVEDGVGGLDEELFANCTGLSGLTAGKGIIHVLPATGLACQENPENVLGKLARAMIETPQLTESPKSVRVRSRELISRVAGRRRYDVVLVDARAGLAEISAAAILGLGGDLLLFGVDLPQTFEGLSYLLSQLARLPRPERENDWRERIKVVHAKAQSSSDAVVGFRDRSYEVFADQFYEIDEGEDPFVYSADDTTAPHYAWPIYLDSTFSEFDPIGNVALLQSSVYRAAFGDFLSAAVSRLGFEGEFSSE
jgi:Mrp family chromosome partitioning ATPase